MLIYGRDQPLERVTGFSALFQAAAVLCVCVTICMWESVLLLRICIYLNRERERAKGGKDDVVQSDLEPGRNGYRPLERERETI